MTIPRCGNPDLDAGVPFQLICPSVRLTIAIAFGRHSTETNMPVGAEFDAVRRAIRTWASTGHFQYREVLAADNPDVIVSWTGEGDADYDFGTNAHLAHADTPCRGDRHPQHVHFNEWWNWYWYDFYPYAIDIETVALHELGHTVGLNHSDVEGSVMFPAYPRTERRSLHADEVAALAALYLRSPGSLATSVVINVRQHFGNEQNLLPGAFVGRAQEYTFDCPRLDGGQTAMLLFQARHVSHERNLISVNGTPVAGGVPRTEGEGSWAGQVMLIGPGVLTPIGNLMRIESLNDDGAPTGGLDDFIIDNATVIYYTIRPGFDALNGSDFVAPKASAEQLVKRWK